MSKYIIDVGDAYVKYICGEGNMLCLPVRINEFENNWLNTNIPLTPYTEPDTEKVREEAYEDGYKTAKVQCNIQVEKDMREVGERHYQKGLSDAWEAARKLVLDSNHGGLTNYDIEEIFGVDEEQAIINYSASEAIEKIQQYEQEQEEIKVGDEVRNVKSGWTAVVTRISDDDCLTLMDGNGAIADGYEITRFTKTGRHFPKLVALQEEMRLR